MRIVDFQTIDTENKKKVIFIRVDPENVAVTLRDILDVLANLSWIQCFLSDGQRYGWYAAIAVFQNAVLTLPISGEGG